MLRKVKVFLLGVRGRLGSPIADQPSSLKGFALKYRSKKDEEYSA